MDIRARKSISDDENRKKGYGIIALTLAMLMSSLASSIANVSLPTMMKTFNVSFSAVQWIVLAYLLSITSIIVVAGKLGDNYGRKKIFLIGIFIFTAASTLCGLSYSLELLVISRVLQGIGAAVLMSLSMVFVAEIIDKDSLGKAMGLLASMSAIGTALGPAIGGVIINNLGWNYIYLINIPLGVAAFVLSYNFVPDNTFNTVRKNNFINKKSILFLSSSLLCYSLSVTVSKNNFGLLNAAFLFLSILSGIWFIRNQKITSNALIDLELFNNVNITVGLILNALVMSIMMTTLIVGPFYLSNSLQLNTKCVGVVMSIGPVVVAFSGFIDRILRDKSLFQIEKWLHL